MNAKLQLIAYYLVIVLTLLTIASLKVQMPLAVKYGSLILFLLLSTYYVYLLISSQIKQNPPKQKRWFAVSSVLLIFTCAFLALFQSVKSETTMLVIHILAILNGMLPIVLIIYAKNYTWVMRHLILAAVLIGIGAFYS